MTEKITATNLAEFKKIVRKGIFLKHNEEKYFQAIPDQKWEAIFRKNFDSNFNYAQRIILNKFKEIDNLDSKVVEREQKKIANLDKATNNIIKAINDNSPIIYITDFDNDGSLAQSIINEYLKADKLGSQNMHVEYSQSVNGNSSRGFTVDLVEKILEYKNISSLSKFVIITADNGINSLEEQLKIQAKYPYAEIIVTDHHEPDELMQVKENDRLVIFNPHYKPTEFYKKVNISGATTIGVLLKNVLETRFNKEELKLVKNNIDNINKLSKISNLLDYVDTHPADKPEKDYVITKFLKLQPLLNINNSISKIITGEITTEAIQAIKLKIPQLDSNILYEEAKNIHIQNHIAKVLLKIFNDNKDKIVEEELNKQKSINSTLTQEEEKLLKNNLSANDLNLFLISELNKEENYYTYHSVNPNYIEQLRPLIFSLSADDEKTAFLDALNEQMIQVFESISVSERRMAEVLREGEVITKDKLDNSVIAYTDKHILSIFNRKFLNKVYNDENPGFSLTLDSLDKYKVSGSFRSLYDISNILKDKEKLEKQLEIKIETPGHQKAAGFIIKSTNLKKEITNKTISSINKFINNSIAQIKLNEVNANNEFLLTDLEAIHLIDRINKTIHGNVSNFERITPILQLTKDTIWTDSYTTKQYSMEDIIKNRKYGYISINTNFDKDTVIIPVELIRKIVNKNYDGYLSLSYMDGGVFMADRVVSKQEASNIIDLRNKNTKSQAIIDVFEKDFKEKNIVHLTREQIKDNPFFKYHDYGNLNFDLFERMVIGIIDTNDIDTLTVFDVEANGFGNSKLMNFGSMNYFIDQASGTTLTNEKFYEQFYYTQRGEDYLLNDEQIKDLKEISLEDKSNLSLEEMKHLLLKPGKNDTINYYLYTGKINKKNKKLPFFQVKNFIDNMNGNITYNREIKADMLAYLIKDNDFKVPQEMINLTGITQEILNKYGKETHIVDDELIDFYKDKTVLFGAHNTPYDARVLRANTPYFYEKLKESGIYDSALFSREEKLAYDDIKVGSFKEVNGIPNNIHFYNNQYSDFNIKKFIENNINGFFPDRTGQYLLEIQNGKYYFIDKNKHDIIKVETTKDELLTKLLTSSIPNTSIKYSVEELSLQWMIHALLLSDETFNIKHVSLDEPKYSFLIPHKEALIFFQDNYHFDSSETNNLFNFINYYPQISEIDEDDMDTFKEYIYEFLELNKTIQQKFADSWMYKKVLSIIEPNKTEITNDLVELINYQTNIPEEKIRTIFNEACEFKQKYEKNGMKHIIQHEGHINGPWEGDNKGDVAFEDKLTLSLLAQRMYNPYSHESSYAIKTFNKYAIKARKAFDLSDQLSTELANDSYSYRQGLLYNRTTKSNLVNNIQTKEDELINSNSVNVVKFKLSTDILNQDTSVYGITKNDTSITREDIEQDSDKLSFILANEQIRFSLNKIDNAINKDNLENILNENDLLSLQYKFELSNKYRYIEFNKKDHQCKKLLDNLIKLLHGDQIKNHGNTVDIDNRGYNIIEYVLNKYIETNNAIDKNAISLESITNAKEYLSKIKLSKIDTNLENAIKNNTSFTDFNNVLESNFLPVVNIKVMNPLKTLLKDFADLRLINKFIDKYQNEYIDTEDIYIGNKSKLSIK